MRLIRYRDAVNAVGTHLRFCGFRDGDYAVDSDLMGVFMDA